MCVRKHSLWIWTAALMYSCGRLSWLNCQLWGASEPSIITLELVEGTVPTSGSKLACPSVCHHWQVILRTGENWLARRGTSIAEIQSISTPSLPLVCFCLHWPILLPPVCTDVLYGWPVRQCWWWVSEWLSWREIRWAGAMLCWHYTDWVSVSLCV